MKARKIFKIIGIILSIISIIALGIFSYFIINLNILPIKYLIILFLVLLLIYAVLFFGLLKTRRIVFRIISCVVSILLTMLMVVGINYMNKANDFLKKIVDNDEKVITYEVITLKNSEYNEIGDLEGKKIGYNDEFHNEQIHNKLVSKINYEKILDIQNSDLYTNLKNSEIDAIVLEKSYLEFIKEMREDFEANIKIIYTLEITELITDDDINYPKDNNENNNPNNNENNNDNNGSNGNNNNNNNENNNNNNDNNNNNHNNNENNNNNNNNGNNSGSNNTTINQINDDAFIFYISGIDQFGNVNSVRGRSDVNQLAVVNMKTNHVLLVNTPRDYYVQLAGTTGLKDKLTHAGFYGINKSVATLENLYEIDIDYYIRVNFDTLIKVVDEVGGIDVYSEIAFTPWTNKNIQINAGWNHLDGAGALAFSRERKSYLGGDRHRGTNQQQVITAIINKVTDSKTLIANFNDILKTLAGSFQTNMPMNDITGIIKRQINDMPRWTIESMAVNGTDSRNYTYSMGADTLLYVMEPDINSLNNAKDKIQKVLDEG